VAPVGERFCALVKAVTGFFVFVIMLSMAGSAPAEVSMFPDIQRIVESGKIVVAVVNVDRPPFIETDDSGSPGGFDIELARLIARTLDVKVEFLRTAETFDDVADQVATGTADIAVSFLSRTPYRARAVYFTRAYATQGYSVLINRVMGLKFGRTCPEVVEVFELAKWPGQLGVLNDTSHEEILREILPEAQPKEFDSLRDMIEALYEGEIVASVQGELSARRFLLDNPSYRIRLRFCEIGNTQDGIAIAVRPDAPNLVQYLNVVLDEYGIYYDVEDLVDHEGPWSFSRN